MVESGCGKPGDRPDFSYWTEQERAGTQVRVSGNDIEEKIDQMIEGKQQLSRDLLKGGADLLLTELQDQELLRLVALDLNSALKET
jgi:hypothetical protein